MTGHDDRQTREPGSFKRRALELLRDALPDASPAELDSIATQTAAHVMLLRRRLDEDCRECPSEPLTGPESPSAGPDA